MGQHHFEMEQSWVLQNGAVPFQNGCPILEFQNGAALFQNGTDFKKVHNRTTTIWEKLFELIIP